MLNWLISKKQIQTTLENKIGFNGFYLYYNGDFVIKFAEYLLSGLPVIISEKIGDFSEFVKQNNLGFVTRNNIKEIRVNFPKYFIENSYSRMNISKLATEKFSKQIYLPKLKGVYNEMFQN